MNNYPLPKIVAHRGASGYAPENTMAAFRKAHELGFNWVEFDVVLTKDGVPIIFHDATTTRTTDCSNKNIADLTLAEVQKLDAGSWFAAEFYQERIPTLVQVLEFLVANDMHANIEIKPTKGLETQTARTALDVVKKYYPTDKNLPLISSFATECLSATRYIHATMPLAFLKNTWESQDAVLVKTLQCKCVNLSVRTITEETIKSIKNLGCGVMCYVIDDVATADKLFNWGVNGIFTNFPDKFRSMI